MKTTTPKLNVKLLRKVQKHILGEPVRLEMSLWASTSNIAPCGTVGCIAGWAVMLNHGVQSRRSMEIKRDERIWSDVPDEAQKLLGLSQWQRNSLFIVAGWPARFATRYWSAAKPKTRAKIAAARIEHLITTGE